MQAVDGGGDIAGAARHGVVVAFHHLGQVELREGGGNRLLDAAVGILDEVFEPASQVDGGDGGELHGHAVGAGQAEEFGRRVLALACVKQEGLHAGDGRVLVEDVDLHAADGLVGAGLRRDGHVRDAGLVADLDLEVLDLLAGLAEAGLQRGGTLDGEQVVGLDAELDLAHAVLEGDHGGRDADGLADAERARERGLDHHGLCDVDILGGAALCAAVRGDDHGAERTDVLRHLDAVGGRLAGLQLEGTEVGDHRLEPVCALALEGAGAFFVTADCEQLLDVAAVGADDGIIFIPGAYAEGFLGVEGGPGVRGLEAGEREESLVHEGHDVAHGAAALLLDLEAEGGFGLGLGRHVEHRLEVGGGILHVDVLHAVEADRGIVVDIAVRLDEGDGSIGVRRHLLRDGDADLRAAGEAFHAAGAQDAAALLDGDEGAGARGGRNRDAGGLADHVFLLVDQHVELRGALGGIGGVALVDFAEHRGGVAAAGVRDTDIIEAVGGVGPVIAERTLAAGSGEGLLVEEFLAAAGHVVGDLAGGVPPPAPAHVIDLGVQPGGVDGMAVGIDRRDLELLGLARLDEAVAPLALLELGLDAHVGLERGQQGAGIARAEVAARLEGAEGESGRKQARGGRFVDIDDGADARRTLFAGQEVIVGEGLLLEGAGVILEVVALPALEAGRGGGDLQFAVHLEIAARGAVEPGHGHVEAALFAGIGGQVAFREMHLDIELVGLDGLDAERLAEGLAAQAHVHAPAPRGGVFGRREREMVEVGGAAACGEGLHELAVGIAQLRGDGMARRERGVVEKGHDADVQRVARAPDAAFAEDIGLDAAFVRGAADVEVAGGEGLLVAEVEVGEVLAARGGDEAAVLDPAEGDAALAVGLALGQLLLGEAVELDAGAGDGLARQHVVGEDLEVAVAALGDQHEVARQQIDAALLVGVIVAEGGFAVPEIFFHEGLPAADLDVVDRAGLGLDQLVDAEPVGLPLADVVRIPVAQHEGRVGDDVGHLVELIPRLVAVQLQELQDVAAEHLLDAHLRLGVGYGAEQQVQAALGRQDGAFADEADGGDFGIDVLARGSSALGGEGQFGAAADGGHGRTGGLLGAAARAGGEQTGGCGQSEEETDFFHRKILHLFVQWTKLENIF